MAGSYNHIRYKGKYTMSLIENLRDANGALQECFFIIEFLSEGDQKKVKKALNAFYKCCRREKVSPEVKAMFNRCQDGL